MRAYEFINEQYIKEDFKVGWEVLTPDGDGVIQKIDGRTAYIELYDHPGVHPYTFDKLMIIDTHNIHEQSPSANAYALVGSGRGGSTKKPGVDSAAHKKVRTPDTTYSRTRKKYNAGAKPGAVDGFVG